MVIKTNIASPVMLVITEFDVNFFSNQIYLMNAVTLDRIVVSFERFNNL